MKNEFNISTKFYETYGDRNNIDDARLGKEFIFGDSQFGVVIENTSHRGYFTEKIMEMFLLKTIPVYWGCPNIDNFFDSSYWITVEQLLSFDFTEQYYYNNIDKINKNFEKAKPYCENLFKRILEIK